MLRSVAIIIISLCVVAVSWFYQFSVEDEKSRSSSQVRHSTVQRQHAEQRLARLNAGKASPLLRVLGEDVSAVQIRIAEYLMDINLGSGVTVVSYEQSLLAGQLSTDLLDQATEENIKIVRILRLDVQVQLAHAQEFLVLMQGIISRSEGWPAEVRACDLQKTPLQTLTARCVMDIYHWLATPDESDG